MDQLRLLAEQAWGQHIRGASLKRNALMKPFDMILDHLEATPKPEDRDLVRAALVEEIFGHLERIAPAGRKPGRRRHDAVVAYVAIFFDGVLGEGHHGDVNRLLARAKLLRAAYLFYLRACIPAPRREGAYRDEALADDGEEVEEEPPADGAA